MRLLRWLATTALSASTVACSAIIGFSDLEKVDGIEPAKPPTDPTKDAGDRDTGSTTSPDAGGSPDADAGPIDAGPEAASKKCPTPAPTYYPPYKSPPTRPKPCTSADITTFVNNEQR